jgi:hypothetical protein
VPVRCGRGRLGSITSNGGNLPTIEHPSKAVDLEKSTAGSARGGRAEVSDGVFNAYVIALAVSGLLMLLVAAVGLGSTGGARMASAA